jgi:DNA-binding transcriptional LysR family regulator
MDWRALRFDWNRAKAFLVAAEEGSFSAAARALGLSQPTLSRQIEALEAEWGVMLFERTGRGLALTGSGLEVLQAMRGMGEAASMVSLAVSGQAEAIAGPIAISASEVNAAYLLPPIVSALRVAYPGLEIEVVATNAPSDLRRREADIAIRNMVSTQPDLVCRKIGDDEAFMYATPALIEKLGHPQTFADLADADFLGFAGTDVLIKALNGLGVPVSMQNFPVLCDSHLIQWQLVKQGVGIGLITAEIGDAEPTVRRVLPNMAPIMVPMWLVAHRELKTSLRVRVVFDHLVQALGRRRSSAIS